MILAMSDEDIFTLIGAGMVLLVIALVFIGLVIGRTPQK
jgi:hypothetical protein